MPVLPEKRAEFQAWAADKIAKRERVRVRIPFVSPMLTWATTGGVPVGHMCRWYGPEGSGKSLTNWGLTIAAHNYPEIISAQYEIRIKAFESRGKTLPALKLKKELKELVARFPDGMSVFIYDTEQRVELDFARRLGVDVDNKDKFDFSDNENVIEEIIENMTAAVEAYHILIVDSVSNAQSYAEANLSPGEYERGTAAQAWKRLRQVRKRLDRQENTIILVDQVRTQLGKKGGGKGGASPVEPPQIRFIKHNASIAMEFDAGRKLYLDKNRLLTDDWEKADSDLVTLGTDGKEVNGLEMRCKVMKNSTGKPYRNSRMRFTFDVADMRTGEMIQEVGFDEPFELLEMATVFGILEKGGGGNYYIYDDDGGNKRTFAKGAAQTRDKISQDEELQDAILERLLLAT